MTLKLLSIKSTPKSQPGQQRKQFEFAARFKEERTGRVHEVPLKSAELLSYAKLRGVVLEVTGCTWFSPPHEAMNVTDAQRDWRASVPMLLAAAEAPSPQDFLRSMLASGEARAGVIIEAAKAKGISERRIQRAAGRIGVKRRRAGWCGIAYWSLPTLTEESTKIAA